MRKRWSRREFTKAGAAGAVGGIMARSHSDRSNHAAGSETASSSLTTLGLHEASELLRSRKVSPVDLTSACLARIEALDPKLNAFITVTAEAALAQARDAEKDIQRGDGKGPLHGVPIAIKDLVDTAGVRTTAASALFEDRVPGEDAEIVRRLKAAGAVLLGKLNMHEFAYGGSTVISASGPVRNPWNLARSAGGSSAGSAAAVAAGLCYGAIGTDTGGSIREPAACCGIVGLKPTFGRVSTRGVIPLSWSLDHVGPMTRRVRDAALMLQALAGYDPDDPASVEMPMDDYPAALDTRTKSRLGVPRPFFYEGLHPEVEAAMDAALAVLRGLTSSQRDVAIPTGNDVAIPVLRAEAYAYHEGMLASAERYHPETLRRIGSGAAIGTSAYIAAGRGLVQLRRSAKALFETVDILVTPTMPVPPFEIADLLADMEGLRTKEMLMLRNTRPFNALGLPTVSVPCGFTGDGLPIGLQITGPAGAEAQVLGLAHAYEQATRWHETMPELEGPLTP